MALSVVAVDREPAVLGSDPSEISGYGILSYTARREAR